MARKPKDREIHPVDEPIELAEPVRPGRAAPESEETPQGQPQPWTNAQTWQRGFFVLVLAILIWFAMPVIAILTVVQFFWMLFADEKNESIADLGKTLGDWLSAAIRFGTGTSDIRPFPWNDAG